jgi:hypothetical protein
LAQQLLAEPQLPVSLSGALSRRFVNWDHDL